MSWCKSRRVRYRLWTSNDAMIRVHLHSLLTTVLGSEARLCLNMNFNRSFRHQATKLSKKVKMKTACRIACSMRLCHSRNCMPAGFWSISEILAHFESKLLMTLLNSAILKDQSHFSMTQLKNIAFSHVSWVKKEVLWLKLCSPLRMNMQVIYQ